MDVRVRGLVHVYPSGVRALDGVDLDVPSGTTLALVGQNGSGKSTLVHHLVGLLRPTEGNVHVGGDPAAGRSVARLAARVGLCFQDPADQIFATSVRAEVAFGPRNLGLPAQACAEAVAKALELTGLASESERNPGDLGRSKRRLLTIASVLAMETPIVVLDEPTTGLDAHGLERVEAIVAELAAAGRTVIVISHDMRFVAETSGRVVVMREGRVTLDGSPSEVFAEQAWPVLEASGLEPPHAARVGAGLRLGSTPTDGALVAALSARGSARSQPASAS